MIKTYHPFTTAAAAGVWLMAGAASHAHLTYPATRDFGSFTDGVGRSITITGQATKSYGWADGTDADWAHQDDQRYFKLTLTDTTTFTLSVTALDPQVFLPAFSIYAGVGHAATDSAHPDSDEGSYTQIYLSSLDGPAREGAFDALHTFKIGNDDDPSTNYVGGLITLTYMNNVADGTAANYGTADGIHGDGVADGFVAGNFTLPAGVYTIAIAGANYASQTDNLTRGFTANVTVVPEPAASAFLLSGIGCGLARRLRRQKAV